MVSVFVGEIFCLWGECLNFPIPLTFRFSTQPRNVVAKSSINTLLAKGDLGSLFFDYAQKKPHVFIVCKYITDYLSKADGFCKVLEFGIDVVKTLLIASSFIEKKFYIFDSSDTVVERTKKYIDFYENINVGIADLLKSDFKLLNGNHDSFLFIQMDSYFSNKELQLICDKVHSIGINDVLLVSPSIVCVKDVLYVRTAIKEYFLYNDNKVRYKRNIKSISNCFSRHYLLFYKKVFYVYDMPYAFLHFKVK